MSVHHLVVMKSNLIDEKALLLANKYNIGIEWFMIASTVLKGKVMHIPKSLYTWTRSPSQKSVIQQQMFRSNISKMQTDIKNTWGEREGPIEQIRI